MNWRVKAAVQKVLSIAPGGLWFNDRLQRSVGSFRRFEQELEAKLSDGRLMISQLRDAGAAIEGARFFEIGSGWYPTLPVCLYLLGARTVVTVDLVRHLQPDLLLRLVRQLRSRTEELARLVGSDPTAVEARRAELERALAGGAALGPATGGVIDYRAPADAAHLELPQHAVDVVFSNSVLEHIPVVVLDAIFAESWRILRPGGVIFHSVNCGDHYAYTDPAISQLNYLRYSARQWELLWNNSFQYQNRLRAVDFLDLARKHGFSIVRENTAEHLDRLDELRHVPVSHEFRGYSPEELCVTTVDFIARKES